MRPAHEILAAGGAQITVAHSLRDEAQSRNNRIDLWTGASSDELRFVSIELMVGDESGVGGRTDGKKC